MPNGIPQPPPGFIVVPPVTPPAYTSPSPNYEPQPRNTPLPGVPILGDNALPSYATPTDDRYVPPTPFDPGQMMFEAEQGGRALGGDLGTAAGIASQGAASGALFGFDDEIIGAIVGALGGRTVMEAIGDQRERQSNVSEALPWLYAAGQLGGGALTGAALFRAGLSPLSGARPTVSSVAPRATVEGLLGGALFGAGVSNALPNEEGVFEWPEAARSAAIAGATGAIGGALGGTAGQIFSRFRPGSQSVQRTAPSAADLRTQYDSLLAQARQIGLQFETTSWDRAMAGVRQTVIADGLRPRNAPQAFGALDEIESLLAPTLDEIESVRRNLGQLIRNTTDETERAAAIAIRSGLDDYILGAGPNDVLAGSPEMAAALLGESRDVYRRLATAELIDDTVRNALLSVTGRNLSQGDRARAIRNEFARLLRNDRLSRRFNADELALIENVANSSSLEHLMTALSQFSLSSIYTNPLRTMLSLGAAGAVGFGGGGLPGALAVPAAGELAGLASRGLVNENTALLSAAVRAGVNPQLALTPPMAAAAGGIAPMATPGVQEMVWPARGAAPPEPALPPGFVRVP